MALVWQQHCGTLSAITSRNTFRNCLLSLTKPGATMNFLKGIFQGEQKLYDVERKDMYGNFTSLRCDRKLTIEQAREVRDKYAADSECRIVEGVYPVRTYQDENGYRVQVWNED